MTEESESGKTLAVVASLMVGLVGVSVIGIAILEKFKPSWSLGYRMTGRNISAPRFYALIGIGSTAAGISLVALAVIGGKHAYDAHQAKKYLRF